MRAKIRNVPCKIVLEDELPVVEVVRRSNFSKDSRHYDTSDCNVYGDEND